MNIIEAILHKDLFRPFLEDGKGKLASWQNWNTALRCLYGLKIKPKHSEFVKQCTGRELSLMPKEGFRTALFLIGRRGGKSRIAAVIGAYEACLSGKEEILDKGEMGLVAIIAPTKKQARIIKKYLRAIFETPELEQEVVNEYNERFELRNGVTIEILVGDYRAARGYTCIAIIVDEICFFGLTEESKVRSDTELIRAIEPGLATTEGLLICISSPYARKGWAYKKCKKNFGNDKGEVLVFVAPTRVMNPKLPQSVVDKALAEDRQAALSEYMAEWRDDVVIWLPREVIEGVVVKGRIELLPDRGISYQAFVDVSGGRAEGSALAIGYRRVKDKKVIVSYLKNYKSPHDPHQVIESMAEKLRDFGVSYVTGDNYAGEFVGTAFKVNGIGYRKCPLPKSGLYLELLPTICSNGIELLDSGLLVDQLAGLERRTRSFGKEKVDHIQGGKDDLANATAGLSFICSKPKRLIGGLGYGDNRNYVVGDNRPVMENLRVLSGTL